MNMFSLSTLCHHLASNSASAASFSPPLASIFCRAYHFQFRKCMKMPCLCKIQMRCKTFPPKQNHQPKHPPHHHHLPTTCQQPASSLVCCASLASPTSNIHHHFSGKWTSKCLLTSQEYQKQQTQVLGMSLNCASSPAAANFVCRSSFKASP